jgi:serine/threonine protein kinase/outer membrane protein assembly factor BamB
MSELRAERDALIEELAERYLDALQAGEAPDRQAILAAYPEIATALGRRLSLVEAMHRLAPARLDDATSPPGADGRAVRVTCPHCGNGIQLIEPECALVTCRNCGTSFPVDPDATAPRGPAVLPRTIGKFDIQAVIGRGTFGTVYRAHDPELGRTVAVKVPRAGYFGTKEEEERFLREARSAAQLNHPGIVKVLEIARERGVPYIVSDFIDGSTLAEIVTGDRLGCRASAELTARIAEALAYAHSSGIIHRDVKPSNILVDPSGLPHLTDFGLARRDDSEITMTQEGQILGTPAYMSPEQASGDQRQVGTRSDVYSLGVVLYVLLTGALPFRGNSRMLLHQVLHDDPKPPRGLDDRIPRDLETICLKAMAKEPARRYGSAQEFADDLRRYLKGDPIQARPQAFVEKAWRFGRRHPNLVSTSAAMVIALFSGLLFYFTRPASLSVESKPAGALVLVDGRVAGTTPARIARLAPGVHRLALEKDGYNRLELPLNLRRAASHDISLPLVPSSGTIYLTTEPSGADLSIRNRQGDVVQRGKAPLLATLKSGRYTVQAESPLHQSQEQPFEIRDALVTELGVHLESTGTRLMLDSDPPGASVLLESEASGEERRLTMPFNSPEIVAPGRYSMSFLSKGHFPSRITATLGASTAFNRRVTLAKMDAWAIRTRSTSADRPTVADLNGDGWLDVVTTHEDGGVLAAIGKQGKMLWFRNVGLSLWHSAVVADVDVDGRTEVVVAGGVDDQSGKIVCLDASSGREKWSYAIDNDIIGPMSLVSVGPDERPALLIPDYVHWHCVKGGDGKEGWTYTTNGPGRNPAVEMDLNHDGRHEILGVTNTRNRPEMLGWTTTPTYLMCVDSQSGRENWKTTFEDRSIKTAPVSYDCDRDGVDDLLVIADEFTASGIGAVLVACSGKDGRILFAHRFDGIKPIIHAPILSNLTDTLYIPLGNAIHRFDLKKRAIVRGPEIGLENVEAVTMADTDGDGRLEAILSKSSSTLLDIDVETGRQLWEYHADGGIPGRVALADLDGDRSPECLFSTREGGLHCLTGLARKPDWRVYVPGGLTIPGVVADVNRDGNDDVIVAGTDGTVRAFDGLDGQLVQSYVVGALPGTGPVVADIDRDGRPELIAGSSSGVLVSFDLESGKPRWKAQLDDAIGNVPVVEDVRGRIS